MVSKKLVKYPKNYSKFYQVQTDTVCRYSICNVTKAQVGIGYTVLLMCSYSHILPTVCAWHAFEKKNRLNKDSIKFFITYLLSHFMSFAGTGDLSSDSMHDTGCVLLNVANITYNSAIKLWHSYGRILYNVRYIQRYMCKGKWETVDSPSQPKIKPHPLPQNITMLLQILAALPYPPLTQILTLFSIKNINGLFSSKKGIADDITLQAWSLGSSVFHKLKIFLVLLLSVFTPLWPSLYDSCTLYLIAPKTFVRRANVRIFQVCA